MINTVLLVLLFATIIIFAKISLARLAVIHALTNSGMGSALTASVVALRSDASSKRELAKLIGGREQLAAADAADLALAQGLELMHKHNRGQASADAENKNKLFR
jgi:hypothetical protein